MDETDGPVDPSWYDTNAVQSPDPASSGSPVEPSSAPPEVLPESSVSSSLEPVPTDFPSPAESSFPPGDVLFGTSDDSGLSSLDALAELVRVNEQLTVITWGLALLILAAIPTMFAVLRR